MYNISIYIETDINSYDNHTIGGAARYTMIAEKDGKTANLAVFTYKDDSLKRIPLYIYGMYDALNHIKVKARTLDFYAADRQIGLNWQHYKDYLENQTQNRNKTANFAVLQISKPKNFDAWEKFRRALKEITSKCRVSYMSHEDMVLEIGGSK